MLNMSHSVRRNLMTGILPLMLVSFLLTGCEDEYTPTAAKEEISEAWISFDDRVDVSKYRGAAFLTADKGFLVGTDGTVLATTDGGEVWTKLDTETDGTMWDIDFRGNVGVIVGDDGTVLRSLDGGDHWASPLLSPGITEMFGVHCSNEAFTWAVGTTGLVIVSEDNGWTWSRDLPMTITDTVIDSTYLDPDSTLLISTVITTSNIPIGSLGTFEDINDVEFTDFHYGMIVGNAGTILLTSDTAQSWSTQTSNTSENLNKLSMLSSDIVVVAGDNGTILRTINAGTDWSLVTSGTTEDLLGMTFANATNGWITGAGGTILVTTNGGTSWTAQTSGIDLDLWAVSSVNATTLWVAGNFSVLNSSTGGSSWAKVESGAPILPTLTSIVFTDANNGWAAGVSGTIIRTINGGDSWKLIQNQPDVWFDEIEFINDLEGWAVGGQGAVPYHGLIQHTTDGGLSWTVQDNWIDVIDTFHCSTIDTSWIHAIEMIDATTGYAAGGQWSDPDDGLILKTTDGGSTWSALEIWADTLPISVKGSDTLCNPGQAFDTVFIDRTSRFQAISFTDVDHGWAVGMGGIIMYTANGGANWIRQNSQYVCTEIDENTFDCNDSILVNGGYGNYNLNDVYFMDNSTGWAVGTSDSVGVNVVLHTTDAGGTWTRLDAGSGVDLSDIEFANATDGWIVGSHGMTYLTTDAGLSWTAVPSGTTDDMLSVYPFTSSHVWVVGENGLLLETESGGL